MSAAAVARLRQALEVLPPDVAPRAAGPWLVGGALRRGVMGMDVLGADLDFFFPSMAQLDDATHALDADGWIVSTSKTVVHALKDSCTPVSLIRAAFPSAERVLLWADFTACQFAFDGIDAIFSEQALADVRAGALHLNRVVIPADTYQRALKYQSQGLTLDPDDLVSLVDWMAGGVGSRGFAAPERRGSRTGS